MARPARALFVVMLLGGDAVAAEPYELFVELLDPLSQILDDAGEPRRGSIPIPYHDMQPRQHRARFLEHRGGGAADSLYAGLTSTL